MIGFTSGTSAQLSSPHRLSIHMWRPSESGNAPLSAPNTVPSGNFSQPSVARYGLLRTDENCPESASVPDQPRAVQQKTTVHGTRPKCGIPPPHVGNVFEIQYVLKPNRARGRSHPRDSICWLA